MEGIIAHEEAPKKAKEKILTVKIFATYATSPLPLRPPRLSWRIGILSSFRARHP
jgi:hypothetical protein